MAEAKVVSTKIKKKNWYPIIAPKIFRGAVLGETTVYDQNAMVGKTITQNLMSLTGDVKRQNISIDFIVTKVEDGKALTEVIGYHMMPASARRMTRRSSEKIDLSFVCATSDGKHVRIKPLMFAISNTKGSVTANIIKTAVDFLVKTVNQMSYDNLINDFRNYFLTYSIYPPFCKLHNLLYNPFCLINSLCFPIWTIFPFSRTIILSAFIIVDNLCAIIIEVLPFRRSCKSF